MPIDPGTLTEVARLCREIRTRLGTDAPLRLKVLAEMLLTEAERPLAAPKSPPPTTSEEP